MAISSTFYLSLVLPARDEAKSIGNLVPRVKKCLDEYIYDIILVDDGSLDKTREIALGNGLVVISHETNLGKGAAIKTGAHNAKGDLLVFIDSDGAHDPQDIPSVIKPILEGKADMVIGSRALMNSRIAKSPPVRRLSNGLASMYISFVISVMLPIATRFKCRPRFIKITDCTSGFRAITREAWEKLDLTSSGFQIETEMIYEAAKNGLAIAEVPISCHWDHRHSRLSIFKDGLATMKLLAGKLVHDVSRVTR